MSLFSSKGGEHRDRGFRGPINQDGEAQMSRTSARGVPLFLFEGGSGTGTPDDKRSPDAGRAARASRPGRGRK